MPDILSRLRSAYAENPASALKLLPQLFQAAGEGLIVELPCSPGDMLYVNSGCLFFHGDKTYTPCEVVNVRLGKDLRWKLYLRPIVKQEIGHYHMIFPASSIGITVFLDREAAEAALKEREI